MPPPASNGFSGNDSTNTVHLARKDGADRAVTVSALLASGNELARSDRWGSSKDGFVCYLTQPLDLALIRERFELPESVVLSEKNDLIACKLTWATIYGSQAKKGVW